MMKLQCNVKLYDTCSKFRDAATEVDLAAGVFGSRCPAGSRPGAAVSNAPHDSPVCPCSGVGWSVLSDLQRRDEQNNSYLT